MTVEPDNSGPWWIPRIRWLVLLLLSIVVPGLVIPVYRYQSACRWVEQRGYLRADRFEVAGITIYTNVREVYLKRGTIDNLPTPRFVPLERGDVARLRVFRELNTLVIAGYELPDTGLQEISTLQNLTHIDAIRTNVTEEEAQALYESLPECSIRYAVDGDPRHNTYVRP